MEIRKFEIDRDLSLLEEFLRQEYFNNHNMTSWLPERLHDLIYRMDRQYLDQGKPKSSDYIYLFLDNEEIVGVILPDGDAIYMSIKKGCETIFQEMIKCAEEKCKPLFEKQHDDSIEFTIIANDSLKYRQELLEKDGYVRQKEEDYDNYVYPMEMKVHIDLPDGYKLVYGDEYLNEINKWSACNLGFHPELENPNYQNNMGAYQSRKNSSMYQNSFECLIIDENCLEKNDVCAYCFVYVDQKTRTAFIEPVSTREKYRHQGLGKAMLHGVIKKCQELGIEKCYVNSYDWRRKFYNASGFITEDVIGIYHKKIK